VLGRTCRQGACSCSCAEKGRGRCKGASRARTAGSPALGGESGGGGHQWRRMERERAGAMQFHASAREETDAIAGWGPEAYPLRNIWDLW
jgi:hypothetical protein